MPYIKQQPNKQIFGTKFHLGLYNLSNLNKEKWPHSWLREIGEEPSIFDPYTTEKTLEDLQSYIASKGYFDSRVTETIETANRKTEVFYKAQVYSLGKDKKKVLDELAIENKPTVIVFNKVDLLENSGDIVIPVCPLLQEKKPQIDLDEGT